MTLADIVFTKGLAGGNTMGVSPIIHMSRTSGPHVCENVF